MTPGPVVARVSTNARFTIECAGGMPDGLSSALCVKGYFSPEGRKVAHIAAPEAHFYGQLAAASGVRTLRSVYAEVDPTTQLGVIITEDIVAKGCTFLDALSPFTPDQAAESLDQLARLHASTWNAPQWAAARWLDPRLSGYLSYRSIDDIQTGFDGPIGAGIPAEVRDAARVVDAFGVLATRGADGAQCVIHGDGHVGNVFLDGDGRPGLLDWQLVQRGHWGLDVGYHIASALETVDRERSERDLLTHYLDRLRVYGVDAPAWDDAWTEYREGIVFGYFLWAITLRVAPDIITKLLQRLGAAAAAHDCLDTIGV